MRRTAQAGRRPHRRRLVAAAVAVAGVTALVGVPTAASAATTTPAAGTQAALAAATCAATRPHSGTILYSGIRGGKGKIIIKNTTSKDGVVVLVRGKAKAVGVYIRTHATVTVGNIKPGTYTLDFTTGSRFQVCKGRFATGASYWRFDSPLDFSSPPYISTWTVTLYVVTSSSPSVNSIKPSDFPAL